MLSYLIPFIILILVVVFIHEYGHYYFAKKYGVGVTDFSIGFGQEIFGWNDKSGTRWKICWIPLGGYVKFFGDRNVFSQADQQKIIEKYSEEDQKKLFVLKPLCIFQMHILKHKSLLMKCIILFNMHFMGDELLTNFLFTLAWVNVSITRFSFHKLIVDFNKLVNEVSILCSLCADQKVTFLEK